MSSAAKGSICPSCNKPATGNFCQNCGSQLGGRFCDQCGAKLAAAAAFCNQCGNKAKAGHGAAVVGVVGGQNLAWWIAGLTMFGLIVVVGVSMVRPGEPAMPGSVPTGTAPGTPPDLSSMTPREAADRLYNRVMAASSEGDSTQAQSFLPMAIGAYERAMPLDHDGLFHLSLLQRTGLQLEDALETALQILDEDPDHVLGLNAAAAAALELGRDEEVTDYYRRIIEVYDEQLARGLPEYDGHMQIMVSARESAEAHLGGR